MATEIISTEPVDIALTGLVYSKWRRKAAKHIKLIEAAITAGNFDEARVEAYKVDTEGLTKGLDTKIRILSMRSLLLGAQTISKASESFIKQYRSKPSAFNKAVGLHSMMVDYIGVTIEKQLLQLIANYESALTTLSTVKKEDSVTKDDKADLLRSFVSNSKVIIDGKDLFDLTSSLHNTRLASYGYVMEAEYSGIVGYRLNGVADSRQSEICKHLDGKTFLVSDAKKHLDLVLATDDPAKIKELAPWPKADKANLEIFKAMSNDELVAKGWIYPPFHPSCRTVMEYVYGTIPVQGGKKPEVAKFYPGVKWNSKTAKDVLALNGVTDSTINIAFDLFAAGIDWFDIKEQLSLSAMALYAILSLE